MQRYVREKKDVDKIPAGSGAGEPEAGPAVMVSKSAMCRNWFIWDTSLKNECEINTGSVLTRKVSPVQIDLTYNTRSAPDQLSSAQDMLLERDPENAKRLIGKGTASGVHGRVVCSKYSF